MDMNAQLKLAIHSPGYVADSSQQAADEYYPPYAAMMNKEGRNVEHQRIGIPGADWKNIGRVGAVVARSVHSAERLAERRNDRS